MGLPEWDLVRECIEDNEHLEGTSYRCALAAFEARELVPAGGGAVSLSLLYRCATSPFFYVFETPPDYPAVLPRSAEVLDATMTQLWCCGKMLLPENKARLLDSASPPPRDASLIWTLCGPRSDRPSALLSLSPDSSSFYYSCSITLARTRRQRWSSSLQKRGAAHPRESPSWTRKRRRP